MLCCCVIIYLGLKNVRFGDGWLELGEWRIGLTSGNKDHLSITHKSMNTCMIWRSDGTRHKGPRQDFNNFWERNEIDTTKDAKYGIYYVMDDNDKLNGNKYIKWIQFGDNWRIGDVDIGDHFSISANKVFFQWGRYKTAVIYRRDGTVHSGPRNDFGLWNGKRQNKIVSLLR